MQAGSNCTQAIPSSVFLVINDDNLLSAEVCNASDSDDIRLVENSTTIALLITLKCSYLLDYGSEYTGDLVLTTIGGSSIIQGVQFGKKSFIILQIA